MPGMPGGRGRSAPEPQVTFVIQNSAGDTVATRTGPGTEGFHRMYWDFRGRTPEEPEKVKTPAEVQDSARAVEQMAAVVDSLAEEGVMARPMLERVSTMLLTGDREGLFAMFGAMGGGGGGTGSREFNERPGENWRAGGFSMGGNMMRQMMRMLRPLGGVGALMSGGGGGQAPLVDSGEYTVIMKAGEAEFRQTLVVEKRPGAEGGGGMFEGRRYQ